MTATTCTPPVDTTDAVTFYAGMSGGDDDSNTWDVFTRYTFDCARDVVSAVGVAEMLTEQRAACERGDFEGDIKSFRKAEAIAWDYVRREMEYFTAAMETEGEAGTPGSKRREEAARRREAEDFQGDWDSWCA